LTIPLGTFLAFVGCINWPLLFLSEGLKRPVRPASLLHGSMENWPSASLWLGALLMKPGVVLAAIGAGVAGVFFGLDALVDALLG
jgi:hypothetical protein